MKAEPASDTPAAYGASTPGALEASGAGDQDDASDTDPIDPIAAVISFADRLPKGHCKAVLFNSWLALVLLVLP